ncbi:uncharacterized protein [Rutidosis leptorrhynchoides]|uniref:uncharacterized protein n=1 Tax=Rutidosis leptorrhynchoides TaxID=125765 RepID=UPI003A998340
MTAPIAGETLILYFAASKEAISSVLIADRGQVQMHVYFVSNALTGSESNYPAIEKLVYALVHTARHLRRYFQVHPIMVLTDQPIKQVLYKPEKSGRMAKRAIELGENEISFSPRSAVKWQVLADYLAETAGDIEVSYESKQIPPLPEQLWEMHIDGACGPEGVGAGIVLKSLEGEEYTFALRFSFPVTNNEAEYEALLSGMRVAKYLEVKELSVYVDSQLVANQFNGIFEAHDESMQKYLKLVQELAVDFDLFQITQEVKVKYIDTDSVSAAVEVEEQSWMTPIVEFLNKGTLPIDSTEARKIKMKASMYLLDKGILYRKSFLGPHLRCLNPTQAELIIREVHEGMCALHSGHKTVASKIMRLGYYWTSMYRDAAEFGIPNEIVSDNGTQFEDNPFSDWCQELNIKQTFTSVAHPQANGQCKVTNRDIVLGMKAVIPAKINVTTMRTASFDESSKSEELRENLNLVEERREIAAIKEAINKQRITSYYNKGAQPLSFQLDDLVWRKNEAIRVEDTGKLGPKWEGPYKVIGVSDNGAYRLASLD